MNKKQVVKINEARLKQIVAESVKKVLKENDVKIKQEVESILTKMDSGDVEWITNNYFEGTNGCRGYIYPNEEYAKQSILTGDNHQNAVDYVNGAQTDDEWIDYLINGGVNPKIAKRVIMNHDWDKVVEILVNKAGPEWFLSEYSGQVHQLSNGYLLYY